MKTLKWFIERVGKNVYRDTNGCNCCTCKEAETDGVQIRTKSHAEYMFDMQFAHDNLNYRDKK